MDRLPEPLRALLGRLTRLPGLGPKSALRLAMTLLKWPENETRSLGRAILELRDRLRLCDRCGALSDTDPCSICADPARQESLLCVVTEWDSLLTMEGGGFFTGRYFILGGLLSPLDSMAEHLELERLFARLGENRVEEVVLALGATVEAENTAVFVRNLIRARFPHVQVSRLAQGIPLGAEVGSMDRETLRQSLQYRQQL
jgi:recombination protein RecR